MVGQKTTDLVMDTPTLRILGEFPAEIKKILSEMPKTTLVEELPDLVMEAMSKKLEDMPSDVNELVQKYLREKLEGGFGNTDRKTLAELTQTAERMENLLLDKEEDWNLKLSEDGEALMRELGQDLSSGSDGACAYGCSLLMRSVFKEVLKQFLKTSPETERELKAFLECDVTREELAMISAGFVGVLSLLVLVNIMTCCLCCCGNRRKRRLEGKIRTMLVDLEGRLKEGRGEEETTL